jgi:hypothetical protein
VQSIGPARLNRTASLSAHKTWSQARPRVEPSATRSHPASRATVFLYRAMSASSRCKFRGDDVTGLQKVYRTDLRLLDSVSGDAQPILDGGLAIAQTCACDASLLLTGNVRLISQRWRERERQLCRIADKASWSHRAPAAVACLVVAACLTDRSSATTTMTLVTLRRQG